MRRFEPSFSANQLLKNPQGCDNVHGCYGGTAALLHAADWVCGPSWDGRLALVVASDVAVYEAGSSARATGEARGAARAVRGLARGVA